MEATIEILAASPGNFDRPSLEEFRSVAAGVERSDIFRCAVLYLVGGIYCDVDVEALKSFDLLVEAADSRNLLRDKDLILTTDHPIHCEKLYGREIYMNHFMIARPRARIFEKYFDQVAKAIRSGETGGNPVFSTGPMMFSRLVSQSGGLSGSRIAVMPSEWINPLPDMALEFEEVQQYDTMIRDGSWRERFDPFAVHYWWHSYAGGRSIFSIYGDSVFAVPFPMSSVRGPQP